MLEIQDVLFEENVCLNLTAKTKDEVICELTELLYLNDVISDKEEFKKEIYHREEEGITGIGDGIAIPHGRTPVVKKSVIAIGRTQSDIDWKSFDDKPVRVIIMFAIRDVDISQHIMLLSRVAEMLLDKEVIDVLHSAETIDEIIQVLKQGGGDR
ncbi:MAG: PTS sugar transporter subunit IIA [Erysipelotrichaceae bacterium]|nr:PTS sugar transporter subunit IIA [Erysipelotrichaceae bacterium]